MKLLIVLASVCVCIYADISHLYLPARQSFGSNLKLGNSGTKFGNRPTTLGNIQPKLGNGQLAFGSRQSTFGNVQSSFGSSQFSSGDQSFGGSHIRSQAANEKNAAILKFENDGTNEGFHYSYETENGIRAEESGNAGGSEGIFSYKGDDGQTYTVTYVAGDGGFQAKGAHLPTAPPIPVEILMSLEQNAKDEAAGMFDDGQYRAQQEGGEQYQKLNSQNFKGNLHLQSSSFSIGSSDRKQSFNEKTGYQY